MAWRRLEWRSVGHEGKVLDLSPPSSDVGAPPACSLLPSMTPCPSPPCPALPCLALINLVAARSFIAGWCWCISIRRAYGRGSIGRWVRGVKLSERYRHARSVGTPVARTSDRGGNNSKNSGPAEVEYPGRPGILYALRKTRSTLEDPGRPWNTRKTPQLGRPRNTVEDCGRPWKTPEDPGRPRNTQSNIQFSFNI